MEKYQMKAKLQEVVGWCKANRTEATLLFVVLLLAALLRLWRIDEYLPFLGDEGRDVRVVRRFLTDFDLMFVGPRTSIGDMYLGPLYYYLIAPFLAVWGMSPTGPAVFVALLGTATVFLVWYVAREWFGKVAAIGGAGLFAISPLVIKQATHSWNPHIMPFFALLSVFSIWRVWQKREWKWLLVLGVSFAFVLQSHYLGLLLLPTIGIFWLGTFIEVRRSKIGNWKLEIGKLLRHTLIASVVFAVLMSPLVFFDAKHSWRNLSAMQKFFGERQTTVSARPWNALPEIWPLWSDQVVTELVAAQDKRAGVGVAAMLLVGVLWLLRKFRTEKQETKFNALALIGVWVIIGLLGLGVYKQHIYAHYFGFMFPSPFLLLGGILQEFWDRRRQWLVIVIVIVIGGLNLKSNPLKDPPQRQMQRVQAIGKSIIEEAEGKPFNFALIAKRNYEEGYLYFFELWKAPVREIDPQRSRETITEQLFVVCEDGPTGDNPEPCKPINHPKAEIAGFGWAKIEKEWETGGIKIFKLIHNPEGR